MIVVIIDDDICCVIDLVVLCLQTATLTVGDWCDTQLSIKYGRQIGDYSCSNQVTQVLEAR